ncbi:MAG: hypothetical protein Fur0014_10590 [Rubrivivax sp.]
MVGAALLALGRWHPADRLAPWLAGLTPGWAALLLWQQQRAGATLSRRLPPLALAGALLPAMLQADAAPLALVHAEDHASFDFAARLQQPLDPVPAAALAAWFEAHPRGVALLYVRPRDRDPARPAVFAQPFRGQYAVLVDAGQWRAWLQRPAAGGRSQMRSA